MKKILYFLVPLLLTIATLIYFFNKDSTYSFYANFKNAIEYSNFTNPIDSFKSIIAEIRNLSLSFNIDFSSIFNFLYSILTCIYTFFKIILNVISLPLHFVIDVISDIIIFFGFLWR